MLWEWLRLVEISLPFALAPRKVVTHGLLKVNTAIDHIDQMANSVILMRTDSPSTDRGHCLHTT